MRTADEKNDKRKRKYTVLILYIHIVRRHLIESHFALMHGREFMFFIRLDFDSFEMKRNEKSVVFIHAFNLSRNLQTKSKSFLFRIPILSRKSLHKEQIKQRNVPLNIIIRE